MLSPSNRMNWLTFTVKNRGSPKFFFFSAFLMKIRIRRRCLSSNNTRKPELLLYANWHNLNFFKKDYVLESLDKFVSLQSWQEDIEEPQEHEEIRCDLFPRFRPTQLSSNFRVSSDQHNCYGNQRFRAK